MSTVTKVFIVLHLVFSIALGTMAIVVVGQMNDWRAEAERLEDARASAVTAEKATAAQCDARLSKTRQRLEDQARELASRVEEIKRLAAQVSAVETQFAQQKVENAELSASLSGVSSSLTVEVARAERLEAASNDLVGTATDLRQRNLDLNERVKELTTENTLQGEKVRVLQQQRYVLSQQLAAVQKQVKAAGIDVNLEAAVVDPEMAQAGPITAEVAVPIRGRVELVDGSIAQISVGSDDGVSKGTIFVIFRDGNYLGRFVAEELEANRSAGTLSNVQGEVRVGDKVADEARFEMIQ